MSKLSRSKFLKTAGVATGAAVIGVPVAAGASEQTPELVLTASPLPKEPLVAILRDPAKSEVTILLGKSEMTYRDPELAKRLVKAAKRHPKHGAGEVA